MRPFKSTIALLLLSLGLVPISASGDSTEIEGGPSTYLYVWARDADEQACGSSQKDQREASAHADSEGCSQSICAWGRVRQPSPPTPSDRPAAPLFSNPVPPSFRQFGGAS